MKKLIAILTLSLLLTGCKNKEIIEIYKKASSMENFTATIKIETDIIELKKIDNKNYERKIKEEIVKLSDGIYYQEGQEIKNQPAYFNIEEYLYPIKKAKKVNKLKEEKIGNEKYNVYSFYSKEKLIKSMLKDSDYNKLDLKDTKTILYVNKENQIYKIIYEIEKEKNLAIYFKRIGTTTNTIEKNDDHTKD